MFRHIVMNPDTLATLAHIKNMYVLIAGTTGAGLGLFTKIPLINNMRREYIAICEMDHNYTPSKVMTNLNVASEVMWGMATGAITVIFAPLIIIPAYLFREKIED